ncbi:hypothetical protein EJ05DRAFT_487599 [Pseudovirgaria hyperparasitica]|uniref:Uncharacterized protein n=1 Tax=Pseudovirgaria hyperparasitica TaxID=470096 RepID=A0A6A6W2F9_9PEZI|nr:uncharacterized protein EJ05DRAFT_487599 [Pseudovirgaria hyperparasitica]KAF2756745.1 hypothetical protein EJ05DRAFT_487599 [Pseudovirgaria hyperparasitica]
MAPDFPHVKMNQVKNTNKSDRQDKEQSVYASSAIRDSKVPQSTRKKLPPNPSQCHHLSSEHERDGHASSTQAQSSQQDMRMTLHKPRTLGPGSRARIMPKEQWHSMDQERGRKRARLPAQP